MVQTIKVHGHDEFIQKIIKFSNNHVLIDNNEDWIINYITPYSKGYAIEGEPVDIVLRCDGRGATARWYYKWRKSD